MKSQRTTIDAGVKPAVWLDCRFFSFGLLIASGAKEILLPAIVPALNCDEVCN